MLGAISAWIGTICTWIVAFISLGYLVPHCFVAWFFRTRNLKKAYDAEWALVTGSSSGIGKAIAKRLAGQGLNVVLAALGDALLDDTHAELQATFPAIQFRKLPVDLGCPGYVETVQDATSDIDIQVVFCNAGYMVTGLFDSHPLERHLANLECNAVSAVGLTHLLLQRMLAKRQRGCFVYTSSAAAAIPNPFSVLYASTKSFLSAFGASLAGEVRSAGIDVLVFHPSPVASRFYDKAHKLDALEFFKKLAVDPEDLPDAVFASIGRLAWRDIGPTAVGFRLLMKVLDYNLFAMLIATTAHLTGDFRRYATKRGVQKKE